MADDQSKSSSATGWAVVAILTLVALAGFCLCGGFGLFFWRATRVGAPAGAPGQPVPANQSMLKRFVDEVMGVPPPPPPLPAAPPPNVQPVQPTPPAAEQADTDQAGNRGQVP